MDDKQLNEQVWLRDYRNGQTDGSIMVLVAISVLTTEGVGIILGRSSMAFFTSLLGSVVFFVFLLLTVVAGYLVWDWSDKRE